jgi:hypothetical protein
VSPFVAFFDPSSLGSTIMPRSSFATSVFFFCHGYIYLSK